MAFNLDIKDKWRTLNKLRSKKPQTSEVNGYHLGVMTRMREKIV